MPQYQVKSTEDPRIAPYQDLPCRKRRSHEHLFIAEGKLLVERLGASQYVIDSVLVEASRADTIAPHVPPDTPVYVASRELLRQIVGFKFHHGVMACGRRKPTLPLEQVLPADPRRLLVVACADVQDPENMGGILRSCAAFGVDCVVVSPNCACPFSRRVLRVSMGTVLQLPVVQSPDLGRDLDRLRDVHRIQVVAAVLDPQAAPLETVGRPRRVAILFGNEANGLHPRWVDRCDCEATIPMQGGTDSLNVAVATGVFLYHFTRPGEAGF